MLTGVLRVLATSRVLLLFLLATTTTTLLVQPVDGATTSATSDFTVECETEIDACQEAETCVSCISTIGDSSAETEECRTELGVDATTSSTASCDELVAGVCCLDEVADEECLDNDEFVDYWLCFMEVNGCSEDEIECNGAGARLGGTSNAVAFSCAFMLLLPLLWV